MDIAQLAGKTAVSYARWSSGRQSRGSSSARQAKIAAEYAAKARMTLDRSIVDDGISAFTGDNLAAGLGKFLLEIKSGRVSPEVVLLIENMDRFSRRNPVEALPAFLDALRTGLTIVTLQDEMIHSEERYRENSILLIPSLVSMQLAHDESQKKSERLKASWADRVKRIRNGERIPISKVPFWIDQRTQDLNGRADDARAIFQLASEGHGASAITRMVNERGIPSSKGGTWGRGMIQDVLKSKEAFGTLTLNGHEQPHYYPPIVTETVWLAIRHRAARQRRNPQAATDANLFPRLLTCGRCGSAMNVTTSDNGRKRYKYAVCTKRTTSRNDCDARNWPYDTFEAAFVSRLGAILSTPEEPVSISAVASKRDLLLSRIEAAETRQQNAVTSSIEAETASVQRSFREAADTISRQIEVLRRELADVSEREAAQADGLRQVFDIALALEDAEKLRIEDRPKLRGMIAAVVEEISLEAYCPDDINVAVVRLRGRETPFNLVLDDGEH